MKKSLAVLTLLSGLALTASAAGKKKVTIFSWKDSDPRYAACKNGFLEELDKSGWKAKVEIKLEDADGKKEQAAELAKKVKADGSDVVVSLGTSASVPAAKEITGKPIVIGMVYDPIEAKIIKAWESSGNNVTGASNFVSIPMFLRRLIKRSEPAYKIKKVMTVFTPGEKNSELQSKAVVSVEKELGLTITEVPITSAEDMKKFADGVAGKADLIFVTGANPVSSNVQMLIAATVKHKIVTATHLDDLVAKGVLYGLVADPTEVGRVGGKALIEVLEGKAPSAVPVKYPLPKLVINQKTAADGGFKIPPAIEQWSKGAGA